MHVIAGKHKSRKLFYHQQSGLRPTTAKVKEALFNIIGPAIQETSFLDLFAGGGSIGIEALSRGANTVDFVENNPRNCQLIKKNLQLLGEDARVLNHSYSQAIKILEAGGASFSYVYLDPGYQTEHAKNCLLSLGQSSIINKKSIIIAEHYAKNILPETFGGICAFRRLTYGDTGLTFYRSRRIN